MTIDEILRYVSGWDGVLTQQPSEGDGTPEIAWGDSFFYYAPDGEVPTTTQPFATIVTKDYPDDALSQLDRPDAFRVNIHVGREALETHARSADPSTPDVFFVHPVYGSAHWLAVVDPGPATTDTTRKLLQAAYRAARNRYQRRLTRADGAGHGA